MNETIKSIKSNSEIMAKKIPKICRAQRYSRKGGKWAKDEENKARVHSHQNLRNQHLQIKFFKVLHRRDDDS